MKKIILLLLFLVSVSFAYATAPQITSLPTDDLTIYDQTSQILPFFVFDADNDTLNCTAFVDSDTNVFDGTVSDTETNITISGSPAQISLDIDGTSIYTSPITTVYYGINCTDGNETTQSSVQQITFREQFIYSADDILSALINLFAKFIIGIGIFITVLIIIIIFIVGKKNLKW